MRIPHGIEELVQGIGNRIGRELLKELVQHIKQLEAKIDALAEGGNYGETPRPPEGE